MDFLKLEQADVQNKVKTQHITASWFYAWRQCEKKHYNI
jgi:hypothetical protein